MISILINGSSTVLLLFAVAIALASLLFSNKLVRELTIEERNKIEIWAKATEHLATETDNSDMNLVLRILQGNTTIPVILYDKSNRSFIVNNIKLPDKGRDRFLQKKMEAFSKKRNAIELTELNQSLYYDDSYTLKQLQVFPYVQLAVIAFFIALVFFALRNSLKAQQNRVWVGLSKETAHQLGTPISSLVAWIEFLKLKDIDPALLSGNRQGRASLGDDCPAFLEDRFRHGSPAGRFARGCPPIVRLYGKADFR